MKTVGLSAHFDGKNIELDEPIHCQKMLTWSWSYFPQMTNGRIGYGCPSNIWRGPMATMSPTTPRLTSANELG